MIELTTSAREFRAQYFEKQILLCRGALRERPIGWPDLDALIEQIEPREPIFQLFHQGAPVSEETYTRESLEFGLHRRRLHKIKFYTLLRAGASLVINRFESYSRAARRLCAEVARYAGLPTMSNAYLSFGGRGTFGKHWDTHDVFAIQLIGRKRWLVYAPTLPLPLSQQTSSAASAEAAKELVLDCTLEAGDVLYIPRGWWHQTLPLQESSFHLSVGTYTATLYDYVMWSCARHLPMQVAARRAFVPDADNGAAIDEIMQQLRGVLLDPSQWSDFQDELVRREHVSSALNLGLFLDPVHGPLRGDAIVSLTTCYQLRPEQGEISVNGAPLRLDAASQAVIGALSDCVALRFDDLQARLASLSPEAVHRAVLNLAGCEVVSVGEGVGRG